MGCTDFRWGLPLSQAVAGHLHRRHRRPPGSHPAVWSTGAPWAPLGRVGGQLYQGPAGLLALAAIPGELRARATPGAPTHHHRPGRHGLEPRVPADPWLRCPAWPSAGGAATPQWPTPDRSPHVHTAARFAALALTGGGDGRPPGVINFIAPPGVRALDRRVAALLPAGGGMPGYDDPGAAPRPPNWFPAAPHGLAGRAPNRRAWPRCAGVGRAAARLCLVRALSGRDPGGPFSGSRALWLHRYFDPQLRPVGRAATAVLLLPADARPCTPPRRRERIVNVGSGHIIDIKPERAMIRQEYLYVASSRT